MKNKLKNNLLMEPVHIGLRVSTLVMVGEGCGCDPVPGAGWQCDGGSGAAKMVWDTQGIFSWMDKNCEAPVGPGHSKA